LALLDDFGAPATTVQHQGRFFGFVTGQETHISVLKSFRLAGFGTDSVTFVPTDERGRIIASESPDVDSLTIVMLQAGNVNTGYSDPFDTIIAKIHAQGDGSTSMGPVVCGVTVVAIVGGWWNRQIVGLPTRTSGSAPPMTQASPSARGEPICTERW
jgi:hypothetical protein